MPFSIRGERAFYRRVAILRGMAFIAGNLDLIVLFAAAGSVPGAVVGYLAAKRRGAAIGAVAGVILGPVLWLAGMFLLWPGV